MIKRRKGYEKTLVPVERSRRIIFLDKRGRRLKRYSVPAGIFGILGAVCICYCGGIALAGFGTYFFLIWGGIGCGCLMLRAMFRNEKLMIAMPGWIKVTGIGIFAAGLLLFCTVEGLILTGYEAKAAGGADYCVVLGAQWKKDGPGEALRKRLDEAAAYLTENPDTRAVVSGGQGADEAITEAAGMREYLIRAGIEPERILTEDRSANTYENLVFSGELLDRKQDRVVIVTNNFHVFRALAIAKKQGYAHAEGLAADSLPGMAPHNLLREFFGVVKDFFAGNL